METHTYPHLNSTIHFALFHDVRNAADVRSRIIAASKEAEDSEAQRAVNFAFIDARVIASREQLLNACVLAVLAGQNGSLRTRTVHSEVLWMLMPGTNISDSLRKIGISAQSTSLILVRIDATPTTSSSLPPSDILTAMTSLVDGRLDERGLTDDARLPTDWKALQKLFKLSDVEWPLRQDDDEDACNDARALIASLTAIKNVS